MGKDKFLNLSEAARFLGISEDELQYLAEIGKVPAYKVGGVFLRFKPEQLKGVVSKIKMSKKTSGGSFYKKNPLERKKINFFAEIKEFWHFFDFYIISLLIIGIIIYIIFKLGV